MSTNPEWNAHSRRFAYRIARFSHKAEKKSRRGGFRRGSRQKTPTRPVAVFIRRERIKIRNPRKNAFFGDSLDKRMGRDSNPWWTFAHYSFQDCRLRPLGHPSSVVAAASGDHYDNHRSTGVTLSLRIPQHVSQSSVRSRRNALIDAPINGGNVMVVGG